MKIIIPKESQFIKLSTDRYGNNILTYDPMTNDYMGEFVSVQLVPSGEWQINSINDINDKKEIELTSK